MDIKNTRSKTHLDKGEMNRIRHAAVKAGYKYGLVQCELMRKDGEPCKERYIWGGDRYHSHLLFYHGFFLEPCKTFRAKANSKVVIEGFKVRTPIKQKRTRDRWINYTSSIQFFNYKLQFVMKIFD